MLIAVISYKYTYLVSVYVDKHDNRVGTDNR